MTSARHIQYIQHTQSQMKNESLSNDDESLEQNNESIY